MRTRRLAALVLALVLLLTPFAHAAQPLVAASYAKHRCAPQDHLGSTAMLTDSTGQVVAEYEYGDFGETTEVTWPGSGGDTGFSPLGDYDHCEGVCGCGTPDTNPRITADRAYGECSGVSSRITIEGNTVYAHDWPSGPGQPAPDVGTLSEDGTRLVWSDGSTWVREAPPPSDTEGQVYNPYLYTGQQFDPEAGPSGLYFLRARSYSPKIGRFLSRDPIGYAGGSNLYAYCGNKGVDEMDYFIRVPLALLREIMEREHRGYVINTMRFEGCEAGLLLLSGRARRADHPVRYQDV